MDFGAYENALKERAKFFQYSIALPESRNSRVLAAAFFLLETNSVQKVYLFLPEQELEVLCGKAGLDLARHRSKIVVAPEEIQGLANKTYDHITALAEKKNKKYTENQLLTFSGNYLYQAGFLTATGKVNLTLAGANATTAEVIRAGLATIPLAPGITTVSSSFLMVRERPDLDKQVLLFADCGVIVEPTSEQLTDIASASCSTWQRIHGEQHPPVLAFLSFSTKGSAQHSSLDGIRSALQRFRQRHPTIEADGEMQFDAAFDPEVGAQKCPQSSVPGRATVYIFPNLTAGNIAYKITQRLGGFNAYGPLLQGFSRPFSDLSRGCTVKDIVMSAYINMLLA